jgi:anti-anti-sigma regulatory factor
MPSPTPNLFVSVAGPTAWIRITGRANFTSSVPFKTLAGELFDRGFREFMLELHDCATMDSTFLGVMAGLALQLNGRDHPGLTLVNPQRRILDLLENLGVAHLFLVTQQQCPPTATAPESAAAETESPREEVSRTVLEAHQTLMRVNPENIPKFKNVTEFLVEDLKNLKPGERSSSSDSGS